MLPQNPNNHQMISSTGVSLRMICGTRRNFIFLLIFSLALILMLYTTFRAGSETTETNFREVTPRVVQKQVQFRRAETNTTVKTTEQTRVNSEQTTSKPFIYLTQTEQCLPAKLSSSRGIGDNKTCNCDVIVLSYRKECQEKKRSHISYIFVRESTWTSGRNILYFVARERMRSYHYYIFLDDDVDLGFNSFTPQKMRMVTPFRAFERWLLDNEPAVGLTEYGDNRQNVRFILERRRMLCGIKETSMVVPVMWIDAIFNAFHHKAIDHILPYPTQYDKESWWTSQLHVICSIELKFRGQALLYVPITVYNGQHRAYPRIQENYDAQVRAFVEEIQNRAPIAYQKRTLFKKLKSTSTTEYYFKTTTYCMNTTRHPIVPYSHFEHEGERNIALRYKYRSYFS
ncbi:uncharacterized protein LOC144639181 [Oculina patagonica]